jgi:hypothetical protein
MLMRNLGIVKLASSRTGMYLSEQKDRQTLAYLSELCTQIHVGRALRVSVRLHVQPPRIETPCSSM